ncbi:MAG: GNAT family N-acetyltransferase, partial [Actinobacteria bacterium]
MNIRRATAADIVPIAAFTERTFEWGDYVGERMADWLDDPAMVVMVAADDAGSPIGLARGQMLSPTEAWFGAARVHPEHRGKRIAGELASALMDWAREHGARVGRLLIEDWNEPSIRHVARIGMRRVASFSRCQRPVGDASPVPGGNGGKRVPAPLRGKPARSPEAEPAFTSWSVGELGRAGRGLFSSHWSFRRLTVTDLEDAARREAFWEIGGGWALGSRENDAFEVGWLETRPDDAAQLIAGEVPIHEGGVHRTPERLAVLQQAMHQRREGVSAAPVRGPQSRDEAQHIRRALTLGRQIGRTHRRARSADHQALDHVLQLADVAGPTVAQQQVLGIQRQRSRRQGVLPT